MNSAVSLPLVSASAAGDKGLLSAPLCCETSRVVDVLCFFMPWLSCSGEDGWNVEEWKAMVMEVLVGLCKEQPSVSFHLEQRVKRYSCLLLSQSR